jgi:hypothetical protein
LNPWLRDHRFTLSFWWNVVFGRSGGKESSGGAHGALPTERINKVAAAETPVAERICCERSKFGL